jgi:hypothetical protein
VQRVDDLADVGLLDHLDLRIERQDLQVIDRRRADPVDVVRRVERMAFDVVGWRAQVQRPAFEEHHADVDAGVAGLDDPFSQPVEERRIEALEAEPRLPVPGEARPRASPGLGGHLQVEVAAGGL